MTELDELRQKRLRQLMNAQQGQQHAQEQMQHEMKAQEAEAQIKLIINKLMKPEARERLANIRLVKPDFARQVEILLIQLYQAGKLQNKIDDEALKALLEKIHGGKRESNISHR
ncbi:DNA-binding protein [Candidatus Altiarchaeota archaeon]